MEKTRPLPPLSVRLLRGAHLGSAFLLWGAPLAFIGLFIGYLPAMMGCCSGAGDPWYFFVFAGPILGALVGLSRACHLAARYDRMDQTAANVRAAPFDHVRQP